MCKRLIYLVFIALVLGLSGVAGAQNQISNWEFDVPIDPLDDWDIWTDDNFNSVSIVEGAGLSGRYAMKVDFTDGASGSMLVFHPYLELQQNATYTISFMAKADAPRTVDVLLQARANNNWTVYWIVGSVELTTEPQTYTYQYTHTGSTVGGTGIYDDDVDLHFNQASSDIDVYYDHIWMGEGAPPPPTGPSSAHTPNPSNGTLLTSLLGGMLGTTLSWTAADDAVSHNVYFGENFDDVNDSTGGTFVVNQPRGVEYILVGYGAMPEDPLPDGLVPGTTYYWRVDEVNDLDPNSPWKGNTWSFKVAPMKAFDPTPVDLGAFVDPDVALSWELGLGVAFQTLYIGDDYDTVNDATTGGIFVAGLTTYDPPAPLEFEKTYYWRVDTTTGAYGPIKGDVWSFKTAKEGGGIRADYYHGMNFETYVLTRLDPQIDFDWGGRFTGGSVD
jgi:hypothetical protein